MWLKSDGLHPGATTRVIGPERSSRHRETTGSLFPKLTSSVPPAADHREPLFPFWASSRRSTAPVVMSRSSSRPYGSPQNSTPRCSITRRLTHISCSGTLHTLRPVVTSIRAIPSRPDVTAVPSPRSRRLESVWGASGEGPAELKCRGVEDPERPVTGPEEQLPADERHRGRPPQHTSARARLRVDRPDDVVLGDLDAFDRCRRGAGAGVDDEHASLLADREGEAPVRKEHGRGDRPVDDQRVEGRRPRGDVDHADGGRTVPRVRPRCDRDATAVRRRHEHGKAVIGADRR